MEEVEVSVKKRGRPPKSLAAAGSQLNASQSVVDAAATIPKKRGRPPKSAKVQDQRGRPAKKPVNLSESEADGDDDSTENVAKTAASPQLAPKGRGRPRLNNSDAEVPAKTKTASTKRRKLGRPRKHQPSESEDEKSDDEDDDEIHRPVGRPPSGSVNLNIVRSGRGQGRPKAIKEKRPAAPAAEWTGDGTPPKKRGRPSSNKPAYVPTGRPRGRPKVNKPVEEEADVDEDEDSVEEQPEKPAAVATPPVVKKRGRPSGANKSLNKGTPKPRGRPSKANHNALNHDQDGDDSNDDAASKKPADADRGFNDIYEVASFSKEDSKSTCDDDAANDAAESVECISDTADPESATA
ncbi:chromosomal protein D1 [Drosophila guanche]|uniref:Blast:Chromosomal protein D1 n=1 Tax=Drosophila guanche TaxID=7266 RepID=A0A3B0K217_DROGU|nr:chromosomal protein D1 [Drosophila guanche]XP_034138334.1 chromosomal protein D1 [Drosophila guanche]XP_034138335.1 chromosomal protein D1 [Drosophila guanche]SPP88274.1 blast:Chromosomal protein D1 [Drosophila guanche]